MKKHIKRLCLILTLLLVTGLFCSGALAAGMQKVSVSELGLSLEVPDDYLILKRNMPANDQTLKLLGVSNSYVNNLLESSNLYLSALNLSGNTEITVECTDAIVSEFRGAGDVILQAIGDIRKEAYVNAGAIISKQEIYHHSQTPFIKTEARMTQADGSKLELISCMTVVGDMTIHVGLRCINCSTASYKSMFEQVMKSVNFSGLTPLDNSASTTKKTYTDPVAGFTYTLNDQWTKGDTNKKKLGTWTHYYRNNADGTGILIGVADMLDPANGAITKTVKREQVGNDFFTLAEIKEVVESAAVGAVGKGEEVTVFNEHYYKFPITATQSMAGISLSMDVLCYVRIWNGYILNIYFYGDENDRCYPEFRDMLRSIQYPVIEEKTPAASPSTAAKTATSATSSTGGSMFGAFALGLLLTVAVHLGPILILRYVILQHPVSKQKATIIVTVDTLIVIAVMVMISIFVEGSGYSLPAIALWTFICYKILTKGYATQPVAEKANATIQNPSGTKASPVPQTAIKTEQPKEEVKIVPPVVAEPVQPVAKSVNVPVTTPVTVPEEVPAAVPEGDTAAAVPAKFCIYCGTKLNPRGLFCPNCGERIDGK